MIPTDAVGPREWIVDVYGSFVREIGGWIAVADLLELLETLGVPAGSSRAAISRMKRNDEVAAETRDGRKGYALTSVADEWFRYGTERVLGSRGNAPDTTTWLLASFSVPEHDRQARYRIRSRLQGLGFGNVSGGLMIAPSALHDETRRALTQAGLDHYVTVWDARHLGFNTEDSVIRSAWDLAAINDAYRRYMRLVREQIQRSPVESDRDAFIGYMVNINAWRELPFLDPGLPRSLLPQDWPAPEAEELFRSTANRLRADAWRYVITVVSGDSRGA